MKRIRLIIVVAIVLAIAILAGYFDYYVYALKHPDAPFWTYLVS